MLRRWAAAALSLLMVATLMAPGTASSTGITPASAAALGEIDELALFDVATGEWFLRYEDGTVDSFYYGTPGDLPLLGDWDCDGIDTVAMFRPSNGFIYLRNSNDFGVADRDFYFGIGGDIPIAGDWNGDGCDTFSIYRASEGQVYISNELGTRPADFSFYYGVPGDRPFSGDFDGDGISTVGLYRESTGFVYFRDSLTEGVADFDFYYGVPSDRILAGDWDGDGDQTVGIYRPSESTFYLSNANQQGFADYELQWGEAHFLPVAGTLDGYAPPPSPPLIDVESLTERPDGTPHFAEPAEDPNEGSVLQTSDQSVTFFDGSSWTVAERRDDFVNVWRIGMPVASVIQVGDWWNVIPEAGLNATDRQWVDSMMSTAEATNVGYRIPVGTPPPEVEGGAWIGGINNMGLIRDPDAGYEWDGGHWVATVRNPDPLDWQPQLVTRIGFQPDRDNGPGPGVGDNGERGYLFPEFGYPPASMDPQAREMLDLARAWFPWIELSKNEKHGEILRIGAQVFMYAEESDEAPVRAHQLSQANYVEIVYTLYFFEDGGTPLTKGHPGDNEGFVVGLVRTDERRGRCQTGFEFYEANTRGHLDWDPEWWKGVDIAAFVLLGETNAGAYGSVVSHDELMAEDADYCPKTLSESPDEYTILVSENKHATYFDREVCDSELDGPKRGTADALTLGFFGPIGGWGANLIGFDNLLEGALDRVGLGGVLGLESCVAGRDPYGQELADRVELYYPNRTDTFSQEYLAHEDDKDKMVSYARKIRGDWLQASEPHESCGSYPQDVVGWYKESVDQEGNYHIEDLPYVVPDEVGEPRVPRVEGQSLADACSELHDTGFLVTIDPIPTGPNDPDLGIVANQDNPGRSDWRGSWVVLDVPKVASEVPISECGGRQPSDVRADLEKAFTVNTAYIDLGIGDSRVGTVASCYPTEGSLHPPGTTVTMNVYREVASVFVPPVAGQSISWAIAELEAFGLEYGGIGLTILVDQGDSRAGTVQSTDPAEGTRVAVGSSVDLWVYEERPVIWVNIPTVAGQTISSAITELENAGLIYGGIDFTVLVDPGDYRAGTVHSTQPTEGTLVETGTTVYLWVYEERPVVWVYVPWVGGQTLASAINEIEGVGLTYGGVGLTVLVDPGDSRAGTVHSTDPSEGTLVEEGSTVLIWVYEEREVDNDLTGFWYSTIGYEYDIIRTSATTFEWVVGEGYEYGTITLQGGTRVYAEWSGIYGAGSVYGDIVYDGTTAAQIVWDNGITFYRPGYPPS